MSSESYPYLDLSRRIGADYCDTIAYAEMLGESCLTVDPHWREIARDRLTPEQKKSVVDFVSEREKRA